MEKVAVTGGKAGSRCGVPLAVPAAAALTLLAVLPPAGAQEAARPAAEAIVAEARADQPPVRVQVQTSALPRVVEATDAGFQAPRVDVSLFPANGGGMGAVFGMSTTAGAQPPGLGLAPQRLSVDVGLRFSHRFQNENQIDITAWRRMNTADDAYTQIQMRQPTYGARVEMEIKPAKYGALALDRGFLGMQLEGGGRISIKRKYGGPMVYYRTAF
jgi:hypothetical protein